MVLRDLIGAYKLFFTQTALINTFLLLLILAPVVMCLLPNKEFRKASAPYFPLIIAWFFTAELTLAVSLSLPKAYPILWYCIWGILLLAHWSSWILAIAKGKNPTTMILPMVLPCILLCAIGIGEMNLLLAATAGIYAIAVLIKKRMEASRWN